MDAQAVDTQELEGMIDRHGLVAVLRMELDTAYRVFRADPSFTHFDALQQAMNAYQKEINAWRDTLAVVGA